MATERSTIFPLVISLLVLIMLFNSLSGKCDAAAMKYELQDEVEALLKWKGSLDSPIMVADPHYQWLSLQLDRNYMQWRWKELAYTMKVTEKCDVYSFGVLVLEVIMGEHSGDLLSSLSTSEAKGILLKDILDQRLPPPTDWEMKEVVLTVAIALACLCSDPLSQPTMYHVSQKLSTSRNLILEPLPTISFYQFMDLKIQFNG